MKNLVLTILIALLLISAGQQHFKLEKKQLPQNYVYVPAGIVNGKGVSPFYISTTEVRNVEYRDFVDYLYKHGNIADYRTAKIDTSQWESFMAHNEPYAKHYFQHKAYDNYPVVNMTRAGAQLYCQWLTDRYNATAKTKVEFRLPTEAEWILAAKGGDEKAIYPWKGDSITCQKKGKWYGEEMCNFKRENALALTIDRSTGNIDVTAPVMSYFPNAYGIYNMSGNVAELVAEENFTKGGSWADGVGETLIASRDEYRNGVKAAPNVGFRPVVVLK